MSFEQLLRPLTPLGFRNVHVGEKRIVTNAIFSIAKKTIMSFEALAAPLSVENPFETAARYEDATLYMAAQTIKAQLKNFAERECRTVWTIDGHPSLRSFETEWIRYWTSWERLRDFATLNTLSSVVDNPHSFAIKILQNDDGEKLLVYKINQFKLFREAMEMSGLSVDLDLIATWDEERPILEEFMIMGLFGDLEPCQSNLSPEYVRWALEKKMKDSHLRRDEQGMSSEQVEEHRKTEWERFVAAYDIFTRRAVWYD